uniref:Uncharacterized protein n=1 Tax=Roseihalotalea indica TaxID=2867963 RepID=A0AA49JGK0_9BACT|nr:hypothetical protein K4G66_01610 [Tunicatimonas sp. TK19036]
MRLKILILSALLLFTSAINGQNTKTEMAFYTIGLGSVFSGVGALVNKNSDERWDKVLLKGLGQGALGGYLVYESKNLIGKISSQERWKYSWYGKLVNSAGISIIENAASNRNFWEQWHINLGFNRVEFYTKGRLKVKYKLMPVSLILIAYTAIGNKFELTRTLQTGKIIFSGSGLKTIFGFYAGGWALGNVLLIDRHFINNYQLYSHEIIHIYQYNDFNFINSYLNKPKASLNKTSNTFSKVSNILHFDLQGFVFYPLYLLENRNSSYYNNFFEREAGFYSNTTGYN